MRQKNPNPDLRSRRRGQSLVESALILLVAISTVIAILDFSQLLFTHQLLVERTRAALRWGMINKWDGTGDKIASMVLYGRPTGGTGAGVLGLTRSNVRVTLTPGTVDNPNDARLTVAIVDYDYRFFTPFIARKFRNNYAVVESSPYIYLE
jgi:Flp pilus assembly protein TadG